MFLSKLRRKGKKGQSAEKDQKPEHDVGGDAMTEAL